MALILLCGLDPDLFPDNATLQIKKIGLSEAKRLWENPGELRARSISHRIVAQALALELEDPSINEGHEPIFPVCPRDTILAVRFKGPRPNKCLAQPFAEGVFEWWTVRVLATGRP